jgi:hypothetical protein
VKVLRIQGFQSPFSSRSPRPPRERRRVEVDPALVVEFVLEASRARCLGVLLGSEGTQVKEMTAFMTPQVFPRFGLPERLSPDVG